MLTITIDEAHNIAMLEPRGPLSKTDFESAATIIDPYIEKTGRLGGLIIHTKAFPGWDSFSALCSHLAFVRNHHKKVSRIAFVTDSALGTVAEAVGSHFVNAEIKVFPFLAMEEAKAWIRG
ncbi:STAS/SEC14 domain-containing protein [Petrachloros mirabilis]